MQTIVRLLSCFQNSNKQTREVDAHVEYEPMGWRSAFQIEHETSALAGAIVATLQSVYEPSWSGDDPADVANALLSPLVAALFMLFDRLQCLQLSF